MSDAVMAHLVVPTEALSFERVFLLYYDSWWQARGCSLNGRIRWVGTTRCGFNSRRLHQVFRVSLFHFGGVAQRRLRNKSISVSIFPPGRNLPSSRNCCAVVTERWITSNIPGYCAKILPPGRFLYFLPTFFCHLHKEGWLPRADNP